MADTNRAATRLLLTLRHGHPHARATFRVANAPGTFRTRRSLSVCGRPSRSRLQSGRRSASGGTTEIGMHQDRGIVMTAQDPGPDRGLVMTVQNPGPFDFCLQYIDQHRMHRNCVQDLRYSTPSWATWAACFPPHVCCLTRVIVPVLGDLSVPNCRHNARLLAPLA